MSQAFVELNSTTFKKGDVLTRSGKTATVIEPAIHRTSRKFIGYEVDLLTDGKGFTPQRVTLFTADIRENWTLEPVQTSIPIGRFFEINDDGEPVPEQVIDLNTGLFDDEPVPESNGAPVGAHRDAPSVVVPADDSPVATIIADKDEQIEQLRLRNAHLEARNAELNESLESATAHNAAAADRAEELAEPDDPELKLLRYQVSQAEQVLEYDNEVIKRLTEQLAEARLASAPILSTPAADVTLAPVREFDIVRGETPNGLDKREKNGWQIQYMQFAGGSEGGIGQLGVVYFRYVTPAPVAPEPLRTSVKTVGNMITIIPPAEVNALRPTERAEADLQEVLNYGKQVYEQALAASPIPDFHPLSLSSGVK